MGKIKQRLMDLIELAPTEEEKEHFFDLAKALRNHKYCAYLYYMTTDDMDRMLAEYENLFPEDEKKEAEEPWEHA